MKEIPGETRFVRMETRTLYKNKERKQRDEQGR